MAGLGEDSAEVVEIEDDWAEVAVDWVNVEEAVEWCVLRGSSVVPWEEREVVEGVSETVVRSSSRGSSAVVVVRRRLALRRAFTRSLYSLFFLGKTRGGGRGEEAVWKHITYGEDRRHVKNQQEMNRTFSSNGDLLVSSSIIIALSVFLFFGWFLRLLRSCNEFLHFRPTIFCNH